ncbi:MAG: hypothetical protein U0163_13520 [Gemmatimonadaceae bacterium]
MAIHCTCRAWRPAQGSGILDPPLPAGHREAWTYFNDVQTKTMIQVVPWSNDGLSTWLNADIMGEYRPEMRKYYYDPSKYKSYWNSSDLSMPREADRSVGVGIA